MDIDLALIIGALQESRVLPHAAVGELCHDPDEAVRRHPLHQALDGDRAWGAGSRLLAEITQGFDQVFAAVELDSFQLRGSRHRNVSLDPGHPVLARLLAADLHDANGKGHVEPVEEEAVAAQANTAAVESANFELLFAGWMGQVDPGPVRFGRCSPLPVAVEEELDGLDPGMDEQGLDVYLAASRFPVLSLGWNDENRWWPDGLIRALASATRFRRVAPRCAA